MKVLYSMVLVCFFFRANAQPANTAINYTPLLAINNTVPAMTKDASTKPLNTEKPDSSLSKSKKTLFGIASFYSTSLEGRETSTGEKFSQKNFTAASNNFKLNSWVRVTNLRTGKSVVVRINDRMHPRMAAMGRVVDLSLAAAKKIGLTIGTGITKVKVELLDKMSLK